MLWARDQHRGIAYELHQLAVVPGGDPRNGTWELRIITPAARAALSDGASPHRRHYEEAIVTRPIVPPGTSTTKALIAFRSTLRAIRAAEPNVGPSTPTTEEHHDGPDLPQL